MGYFVFWCFLLLIVLLLIGKTIAGEKQKKKQLQERMEQHPEFLPEHGPYTEQEMQRISSGWRIRQGECFCIDDITWNDLGMDRIFQDMNYTYSAAGEEYLYRMLRMPVQDGKGLDRLEQHISYLMEHGSERAQYQLLFHEIGRTGKYSIYEYLHQLDGLSERRNQVHYIRILLVLASLGFLTISVSWGMLLLLVILGTNMVSYFQYKKEMEPYLTSFSYILRMLRSVKKMEGLQTEAFRAEKEALTRYRMSMERFRKGSGILMGSTGGKHAGNPIEILLDYIRMIFHIDLIRFNIMLKEVKKHRESIYGMLDLMGYMEAVAAIGCYRMAKREVCIPHLQKGNTLCMENGFHPLMKEPVKNSITAPGGILLTGSNASGKSTFLKMTAINMLLAQSIHTCLADRYEGDFYRIFSSMALRDDLESGESYYIAEIKSLKRILAAALEEGNPIACFVDEVLRGTNTIERIAASTQILQSFSEKGILCFAATHDIELTHLLEHAYENYHFEEEIKFEEAESKEALCETLFFSYELKKGRAQTRNAIRLLGMMGYEEAIITASEEMAEYFLDTGSWKLLHAEKDGNGKR